MFLSKFNVEYENQTYQVFSWFTACFLILVVLVKKYLLPELKGHDSCLFLCCLVGFIVVFLLCQTVTVTNSGL